MELRSLTLHVQPSLLRPSLPSFSIPIPQNLSLGFVRIKSTRQAFHQQKPMVVTARNVAIEADNKDRLPADIDVTETKEPNSRVRLSVKVPPLVCQDCYRRVLGEFSKQIKVPGFRVRKKIPDSILINYVGKQHVQQATIESILKRTLPHAMSSVTGKALRDSVRILTKFSEMNEDFSPQDFLSYEVVVDVAPEVKWVTADAYKNLKVVVEIDDEINAERAFETELRRRHKALGAMKIVTDRGLQIGDVVVVDIFATTINEDDSSGEKIPSAETKGYHLDTEESDNLLPGFLDSIIGIRQGETRTFPLQFPDTWRQENLRGVRAQFTVDCKELFYRDLPVLDDSLADKLLPGCSTLNEVKEFVLNRCKEVEQTAREQATDNAILDQLCKMVEVEIPQSLFEEQGRQLYGAKLLELQAQTKLNEEQLASLSNQKAVSEYLKHQRENITSIIKQSLAVAELFRRENLEYSTEELVKEVENSVAEFKRHKQEYDEERVKEEVQEILEGAKVLEWLRENADIHYVTR
ncbi:trigger factor-like protein TIG, Chloroplastic [Aristolochia californica]|uniref:trigger factor-like protein TIG, Chloroplastic n=1 Tax=Aristolochia californica TaxID=171875 RepID=UPI0035E14EB2